MQQSLQDLKILRSQNVMQNQANSALNKKLPINEISESFKKLMILLNYYMQ